jgi:hypothetical protein
MVMQQYQDPSINRMLKLGFWYQEHRKLLYRILLITLIFINVVFWIWTIFSVVTIILSSSKQEQVYQNLAISRSDVKSIHEIQKPEPIIVHDIWVLASANEVNASFANVRTADFVGYIENPNLTWTTKITYRFEYSGGETGQAVAYVLPGEKTYIASLGVSVDTLPSTANVILDINWSRVKDEQKLVKANQILDSFVSGETEIIVRDNLTDISLDITNTSEYSILEPGFLVVARRLSGQVTGVWYYPSDIIKSQEQVNTKRRYLRVLPRSLDIVAYPVMDFFDDSVYQLEDKSENFKF